MRRNPLKDGNISQNSAGIGTVTRKTVLMRAEELVTISGDWLHKVSPADFDQAQQELTGGPDTNPKETALESVPESERWDPVPGSMGYKANIASSEDEDEEGKSDNARLVEEGIAGAEQDHSLEAGKAAAKNL